MPYMILLSITLCNFTMHFYIHHQIQTFVVIRTESIVLLQNKEVKNLFFFFFPEWQMNFLGTLRRKLSNVHP